MSADPPRALAAPAPDALAQPSGSDLCTACGLCCTGLLFDVAPLDEDELPLAEKLHLPLACTRYHDAFQLPCSCHRDKRCTVYASRPSVCGTYACGLLRRYVAGEVPWGEALARVERVTRLADDVRRRVPVEAPPRPLWDEARDHLRRRDEADATPAWRADREALTRDLAALRSACREDLDP